PADAHKILANGHNDAVTVTFFPDQSAQSMRVKTIPLSKLCTLVRKTTKKRKALLPWLKFAVFGQKRTEKNCLRHNDNVVAISGREADYDQGKIKFADAVALVRKVGLQALLYTSASYTDAKPKWRIVLPTSKQLPPDERAKLVARINGVF